MENNCYLIFGDNHWEAKNITENIIKELEVQHLIKDVKKSGCPALTIYNFKYNNSPICIKCLGNYDLWRTQFPKISEFVNFFDKPDTIIYNLNKDIIIGVGEFTETVSVGNSQWQRAQRMISSAKFNVPFLAVYPFGEDRSQKTLRESSAILTYSYIKISADTKLPLIIIFKNNLYSELHNIKRQENGLPPIPFLDDSVITGKFYGYLILKDIDNNKLFSNFITELNKIMFNNIYYDVNKRNQTLKLCDNDLPGYSKIHGYTYNIKDISQSSLADMCSFDWNLSGKFIKNSFFKKEVYPLIKDFFKTYNSKGKFAIAKKEHTKQIEKIILEKYPPNRIQSWSLGTLDYSKPTVIIPLEVWQEQKKDNQIKYSYSDPNGGESVLFPTLLDSIDWDKTNIIYIIYGNCDDHTYTKFIENLNKNSQKIFRAMNTIGHILLVDFNKQKQPASYKIKRRKFYE